MTIERNEPTEQVQLPASCPVGAHAQRGSVSACMVMRLLRLRSTRGTRAGAGVLVSVSEIEKKILLFHESLSPVESQRRAGDHEKRQR